MIFRFGFTARSRKSARFFLIVLVILPASIARAEDYPWILGGFAGGVTLCEEASCYGPSSTAFGASFGQQFTERLRFELEGFYARQQENRPQRFDLRTGTLYTPVLRRTQIYFGGVFHWTFLPGASRVQPYIAFGLSGAFERQSEDVPEGIFGTPTRDFGIKAALSSGAGADIWLSSLWGIRPDLRIYLARRPLGGIRYSAGILRRL